MTTHNKAVPARTVAVPGQDDRQMAGSALRVEMESALAARQMSVSALAREASVQRGDIYRWWRGESRPSRNSLARVAQVLELDVVVLRQALGEAAQRPTAPDDLMAALTRQSDALEALVAKLDGDWEARLRAVEAELSHLGGPGSPTSGARPAPRATAG